MKQQTQIFWKAGDLGKNRGRGPEIIFGQVREDPAPELLALLHVRQPANIFSIASGGCTAFALLSTEPESLTACDINQAQSGLVELKKVLLEQLDTEAIRYAFLVCARPAFLQVKDMLPLPVQEFWSSRSELLSRGLNNCGLIDRQLLRAMRLFQIFIHKKSTVRKMLGFNDLKIQREFYESQWKSWRWQWCLCALSNLVLLRLVYGRTVLERLPDDFAIHIREQLDSAFARSVSVSNPYLWQTFMPHEPPDEGRLPYHLRQEKVAACKRSISRFTCVTGDAVKAIAEARGPGFDFVALSNILDVSSSNYIETLADLLERKTNTGAVMLLRFFFPPSESLLSPFSRRFAFDRDLSMACAKADRGLFCKNIYVFQKK